MLTLRTVAFGLTEIRVAVKFWCNWQIRQSVQLVLVFSEPSGFSVVNRVEEVGG
jgi:hypothetical protein